MQPLMLFILAALAVYRLSRMITDEEGPFSLFTKLRGAFPPVDWVGRGLECIMCVSFWVALPFALSIDWTWTAPLTWLALSSITVIIRRWEQKR
jgi:hypothetical protein